MTTLKKKMWGFIVNPHFYKFYAKVIDKSLHVLPSPEFDAHEVFPQLYVGNIWAAYNLTELKKRNITHIVSAVLGIEPVFPQEFKYMTVAIRDLEDENICDHFDDVIKFIDEGRETGNVFVHCLRGVSRSATIAAAYVMHKNRISQAEAVALLREKRHVISPNPGFLHQLDTFYETITTTTTVTPTEVITTVNSSSSSMMAADPSSSSPQFLESNDTLNTYNQINNENNDMLHDNPENVTVTTATTTFEAQPSTDQSNDSSPAILDSKLAYTPSDNIAAIEGEGYEQQPPLPNNKKIDIKNFTVVSSQSAANDEPNTTLVIHSK